MYIYVVLVIILMFLVFQENTFTFTDGSVIASGAQPPVSVTNFGRWAENRTI